MKLENKTLVICQEYSYDSLDRFLITYPEYIEEGLYKHKDEDYFDFFHFIKCSKKDLKEYIKYRDDIKCNYLDIEDYLKLKNKKFELKRYGNYVPSEDLNYLCKNNFYAIDYEYELNDDHEEFHNLNTCIKKYKELWWQPVLKCYVNFKGKQLAERYEPINKIKCYIKNIYNMNINIIRKLEDIYELKCALYFYKDNSDNIKFLITDYNECDRNYMSVFKYDLSIDDLTNLTHKKEGMEYFKIKSNDIDYLLNNFVINN